MLRMCYFAFRKGAILPFVFGSRCPSGTCFSSASTSSSERPVTLCKQSQTPLQSHLIIVGSGSGCDITRVDRGC